MRVFTVVGRPPPRATRRGSTPAAASASRTRSPAASSPTAPARTASPPSERTFAATLPAPPRWKLWRGHLHDRHRRLGRDARHAAPQELVEHHVARARGRAARASTGGGPRRAAAGRGATALRPRPRARAQGERHRGQEEERASAPRSRRDCIRRAPPRRPRRARRGRPPPPSPRRPRRRPARASRERGQRTRRRAHHRKKASPGSPRSAATCSRLLCRWGCRGCGGLGPAVARVRGEDHPRPLAEDGLVEDHVDPRLPHVVAVAAAGVARW